MGYPERSARKELRYLMNQRDLAAELIKQSSFEEANRAMEAVCKRRKDQPRGSTSPGARAWGHRLRVVAARIRFLRSSML
jgi:hypothetical protein